MNNIKITTLLLTGLLTGSIVKAQQKGSWEVVKTANKTDGRSECGLAAVNGKLYLVGGDGPAEPVEEYDPKTLKWTQKATAPVALHHFQAASLGDKVYVLDAFYQGNFPDQTPSPNTYSYDTKTDSWQQLAGLPADRRRGGGGAAAYKGKLYLVAGIKAGHSSGTNSLFDVYDPKTNKWTALPDAPHIRDHSQAVVIGDKLYAIGGRNTSLHDANNFMSFFDKTVLDVDCYDFKTRQWSTLAAKLPLGTGGGTAVNLDGKIFFIGGERATAKEQNGPRKDVFYLDPETAATWTKAADVNQARNGVGGAVLEHKIYIAGGSGGGPGGPPPGGGNGGMQGPPPGGNPQNGGAQNGPPQGPPPGGGQRGPNSGITLEVFKF